MANSMSVYRQNGVDYTIDDPTVAPVFVASATYATGQYVKHGGDLYRFVTDHPAGVWDATHVTQVIVGSEMQSANEQIGDLKSAVSAVYDSTNMFDPFAIKTGGYYNNSGAIAANANSVYYEDYIPLDDTKKIYYYRNDNPINTLSFCTYTSDKTFIARQNSTQQSGAVTFGSNVAYIRFSLYDGAPFKDTIQISTKPLVDGKAVKYLPAEAQLVDSQIDQVLSGVISGTSIIDPSQIMVGRYYNSSGSLVTNSDSFYIDDYIPVNAQPYYYTYTAVGDGDTISICKYDSSKSFLTRTNLASLSGAFTIESGTAFIRLSVYGGAANKDTLVISSIPLVDGESAEIFNGNVLLNDNQIKQVTNGGKKPCIKWHGSLGSTGCGFYVYLPTTYGYANYDIRYYHSDGRNSDIWRINSVAASDDNLNDRFTATINGELECAIKLHDRDDYSGGMMHGSEHYTNMAFIVDGAYYSLQSFAELVYNNQLLRDHTNFNTLRVIETSTMYDPADETTEFAIHGREYTFTADGVSIRQSIKWLLDETLEDCYLAMITPAKTYTTDFYTDVNFTPLVCTQNYGEYPDVKKVSYFSSTSGVYCSAEITEYPSGYTGSNAFYLRDNNGGSYNKGYFQVCTSGSVTSGTLWKSESKYKFDFVETA